jgi:hypothetical protein
MADIEGILKRLQYAYQPPGDETASVPIPLQLQAGMLDYFARSYIAAASVVAQHSPDFVLPTAQLHGQAVELP